MKKNFYIVVFLVLFGFLLSAAYDFSKIKQNVREFTLENGLKFILLEDHSAPVASFVTYVNAGASDERIGIFGISHFLEHMAFKGTSEIGTIDFKAEKQLLDRMDEVFEKILAEKNSLNPDKNKLEKYQAELKKLETEAGKYVDADTQDAIMKRHGAVGLNAGTSMDATMYMVSLPANKIELWAYLESSRFTDPAFREFFKEREVIKEERRMRTENNPFGKLFDEILSLAFKDHPYRVLGIGPMSNIEHISRKDMRDYFKTNYTAGNIVIGVAGDIYPQQLKKMAQQYFSKLPAGKKNPLVFTIEPKQLGEKTMTIYEDTQPAIALVYHCPSVRHEDFVKFSILDNILTAGRSSRLNKKMVIKDKAALGIFSFAGIPGNKYPGLYLIFTLPNMDHTTDELLKVIDEEIEKIKNESVSDEELASAKTRLKVGTLTGMKSKMGLLMALLNAEVKMDSWEEAFTVLEQVEKTTPADIQYLVKTYLTKDNRSIARLEKKEEKKEEIKEETKEEKK
ncbi:MAG: insulinase family protein [Candidatus Aminicenantes bacterium]|nr:insulinase family protein [Candidatus Aminicenantes bacterium]